MFGMILIFKGEI